MVRSPIPVTKQSSKLPLEATYTGSDSVMQKINKKVMEWNKHVFTRMDTDESHWTDAQRFILRNNNGDPLEDVQNVTSNRARVFGERVLSVLGEGEEQIIIKGHRDGKEMTDDESSPIEECLRLVFSENDKCLQKQLIAGFDAYNWEQLAIRGRVGARVLISEEDGILTPDIFPLEMRRTVFEVGKRGLIWVATATTMTQDAILDEFGYSIRGDEAIIWDYWNSSNELVFIDYQRFQEAEQVHTLGDPPFVIKLAPTGTFFDTSKSSLARHGDSIFSADRELFDEESKTWSIMQTMNYLTLSPPQKLKSKSGKKLPAQPPYRLGRITALGEDEDLAKLDAPDIQASSRMFNALIDGALQRGSISHIDWGNLQFQLSQVAIATLASASRQVFTPRLSIYGIFKSEVAEMIKDQWIQLGISARIGKYGQSKLYTPEMLKGDYSIEFKYYNTLPEETAAAYGLANLASRWMDDRTIRETILKLDNATDISQKYESQTAVKISKALSLYTMYEALKAQGKIREAKILLTEMGAVLKAIVTGQKIETSTAEESGQPQSQEQSMATLLGRSRSTPKTQVTRQMEPPGAGELEEEQTL